MSQAKILQEKAEMFERRAESATDPISRQHYKEMAAHYRSLAVEHLEVHARRTGALVRKAPHSAVRTAGSAAELASAQPKPQPAAIPPRRQQAPTWPPAPGPREFEIHIVSGIVVLGFRG